MWQAAFEQQGLSQQNKYIGEKFVWAGDTAGMLYRQKPQTLPGLKTDDVWKIFNETPFLKDRKGYNVEEATYLDSRDANEIVTGTLAIGLPELYRSSDGVLHPQEEFYTVRISFNKIGDEKKAPGFLFGSVSEKFHLPKVLTDTLRYSYELINGSWIGYKVGNDGEGDLYIINPRMKPLFGVLTKEQFCRIWIAKLQTDVETIKTQTQMDSKISANRLTAYNEKIAAYQQKLNQMSETEKQEQAYALPYVQGHKPSNFKENIQNDFDLPYELCDRGKAGAIPLFTYNESFFDRRLPKTAIQIMMIRGLKHKSRMTHIFPALESGFYSKIDYREVERLMCR
ncbi:MAG: hypothetical protein ACXVLT_13040 [Flavisolibacter sp.]